jgi:menaquinol-cytochrome c reductase cytochrome b subunit
MAAKSKRQQMVDLAVLAPLDWIDERTAFVRGTKWFLFRNVPRDISWGQTLGSAALTAFIVQALTGAILALYYKPSSAIDPVTGKPVAYSSIEAITDELTLGWLVRGMHRWGASVFIILLFLHMGRVFLFGAYKYPRELNWILGVTLLVLAMLEGFTGYLLPWDQTAYWATVVGINLNATAPFLGPFLSDFLRGGQEIGTSTLSIFYSMHMLLIPGGLILLITLHIYLVIRLGVSSPPWSEEAAGRDREEVITGRRGLLEPRPRGDGGAAGARGRPEA